MKQKILNFGLLGALALLSSPLTLQAQTTLTGTYTQTFEPGANTAPFAGSGSVAGWLYWYGAFGNVNMTNDPTMDAQGLTTSGSLMVSIPFNVNNPLIPTNNQQTFFGSFDDQYGYDFSETANGLNYTNVTFDIRVDPSVQPDANGNFGTLNVGFYNTGTMGGVTVPGSASNGWVHLSVTIDKTKAGIDQLAAFLFQMNNYNGNGTNGTAYPNGVYTFWIDNVSLNYGGPPPPPPTLSLEKPIPGLNVIDSSPGINDRQSIISTITNGYSWVNAAGPVTYSFTITNFPANFPSVAAQMFLIAGNPAIPSYESAPDYNEANVVIFAVQGTPTAATGSFQYKVGEPNGNAMIYGGAPYTNAPGSGSANFGSGNLGGVSSSNVYGTWSVTFSQNTNITLTAPDGSSSNYVMTAADAAVFVNANAFVCMLGSQPNDNSAIGQRVVYSRFQVQGSAIPLDDNFLTDSKLNTNLWTVLASAPLGVLVVPTNLFTILDWTVPDAGFAPILGTNLTVPLSFVDLGISPVGQIGSLKRTMIPKASLPAGNQGYFKMIQRSFTQLQVLLPGETNAPGTVSGKTGTPTAQSASGTTDITVNACDSAWHIIAGAHDVIAISSSDTSAFLPNNAALVNGTITFTGGNGFAFSTQGTQTVTATDVSDGTKTASTSSNVTVGP